MVNQEYTPSSYEFNTDKLIEPIRKASVLRTLGIKISTPMALKDYETEIVTIADDFNIGIAAEPFVGVRSTNQVTSVKKKSSVILGNVSYGFLELQRVNDSVLPFDARAALVATEIAKYEQALTFARTITGLDASDMIPFCLATTGATTVTTLSSATFTLALSGLKSEIAVLVARYGSLKNRPLVLLINNVAYAELMALASAVSDDHDIMKSLLDALVLHGGPGSGWAIVDSLGCAVTVTDDIMEITLETDPVMMLMLVDELHAEVFSSPLGTLSDGVSEKTGLDMDIVERWMPFVHDVLANKLNMNSSP